MFPSMQAVVHSFPQFSDSPDLDPRRTIRQRAAMQRELRRSWRLPKVAAPTLDSGKEWRSRERCDVASIAAHLPRPRSNQVLANLHWPHAD